MNRPRPLALDFGRVLTVEPDRAPLVGALGGTDVDPGVFQTTYQALRHDFDRGTLNATQYWSTILRASAPHLSPRAVETLVPSLIDADFASWNQPRHAMHAIVQEALDRGVPAAIVSNMPAGVGDRFVREWGWLERIPHRFFSADFGLAKPEPAFYHHVLAQTGWSPADTLFVDDVKANVDAAAREGFSVLLFTGSEADLEMVRSW